MKSKLLMVVITVISIGYPVIVFFGLQFFSPAAIAIMLLMLALARLVMVKGQAAPWVKTSLLAVSLLLTIAALLNSPLLIRFYPVVVSLTFFSVFAYSLYHPPCVIETLARLTDPDLPAQGIEYTLKVTKVWSGFFLINSVIAAYTALFMSLESWTLYNGFISYVLIGTLFGIEWLIRRKVKANYRGLVK